MCCVFMCLVVIFLFPVQNRSGKSTLVQLLCRLFHPDPATTRISFNGRVPLHRVARQSLRDMISYVAQRPFIFPGTIADNIRMARPDASDWEVECAAEAAGCFIFDAPSPIDADDLPFQNECTAQNDNGDHKVAGLVAGDSLSTGSDMAQIAAQPALSMKGAKAAPLKPWEVEKRWYMKYWPMNVISAQIPTWLAALGTKASVAPMVDAKSTNSTIGGDIHAALPKADIGMTRPSSRLALHSDASRTRARQEEEWLDLWNAPTAFSNDVGLQREECDGSIEGAALADFETICDSIEYATLLPCF